MTVNPGWPAVGWIRLAVMVARRLLFRRPPAFEKALLDRGDERAAHAGSTGGLQTTAPIVERDLPASDRGWLRAQGIDWGPEDTPEHDHELRCAGSVVQSYSTPTAG